MPLLNVKQNLNYAISVSNIHVTFYKVFIAMPFLIKLKLNYTFFVYTMNVVFYKVALEKILQFFNFIVFKNRNVPHY